MRKILLLICVMFSLVCMAQTEHMKFMGIPINGTIDEFATKMEAKGFKRDKLYDTENAYGFDGKFYNIYTNPQVFINNQKNKVCYVQISFNQRSTSLSKDAMFTLYDNIVKGLKAKYKKARKTDNDGEFLVNIPSGYIYCKLFYHISESFGGGVNFMIQYVDKINTASYKVPILKMTNDDL